MLGVEYKHKISNMNIISFNMLEMCNFCSTAKKWTQEMGTFVLY